jgi:H+/Cl- antiporter ClcA
MTFSLAVVAMETTQTINLYLPILVTIATANFIG